MSSIDKPNLEQLLKLKGGMKGLVKEYMNNGFSETEIARKFDLPLHWVMIYGSDEAIRSKIPFTELILYYKRISDRKSMKGKKTEAFTFLRAVKLPHKEKIQLLMGDLTTKPIGVGYERILESLRVISQKSRAEMTKLVEDYGDIGDIAYFLAKDQKPTLLVDEVYYSLNLIANTSGAGKKVGAIASLFEVCSKEEAKYLAWLLRKRIYLGLNTEAIITTVAQYTKVDPELLSNVCLLRGTLDGLLLAEKGNKALKKIRIVPGTFVQNMLAQIYDSKRVKFPCRAEKKYDGTRIQGHRSGDNIAFFSRSGRLQKGVPFKPGGYAFEVLAGLGVQSIIAEFEFMAVGEDGSRLPVGDSHSATTHGADNLDIRFFEILYLNGKSMINWGYRSRYRQLSNTIPPEYLSEGGFFNSSSELMNYYDKMTEAGEEGIMVKDLDAKYYPKKRSTAWLKIKKSTDSIDAVIVKAKYGHGRKSGTFSSYRLAVKHPTEKKLYEIGDISNFTESDLETISRNLTILSKDKEGARVKPEIVLEAITFEIIQSKVYSSGFSLRSPRLVRIRWDKKVGDIDTIDKIKDMYRLQKKNK